ncbi:hypothetical protein ACOSP7_009317 [Xanthoceras sorbifolium]
MHLILERILSITRTDLIYCGCDFLAKEARRVLGGNVLLPFGRWQGEISIALWRLVEEEAASSLDFRELACWVLYHLRKDLHML